ncbi:MAG: hypothetical protein HFJ12_07630 [Bacilli bacterium]|nr:hypothetical protein [Bacilli bacterium]
MYNNPFLYQSVKPSLFSRLFRGAAAGGINWGNLLTNTQKSLGIINQAIPIVYQVKPIVNNAKTMFRIAGAMKDTDDTKNSSYNSQKKESTTIPTQNDNKPIFYI